MKRIVATSTLFLCLLSISLSADEGKQPAATPPPADMMAAMEKVKHFTEPGPNHKILERFLGTWATETRIFMGPNPTDPEKGESKFSWLMKDRWLKCEYTNSMMGMPYEGFTLMGYDNFKKSYVMTAVSSIDTMMTRSEGDMDPSGKAIILYGSMDEYLTGEHDKMVKSVWRFESDKKIILEIHDLPIGEKNTKIVEVTFNKK
ncbi:MAG: hypothetical protein DHS20C16_33570 [Phycisphaerae bacterium]|nr:MAG: hypothetical protein DHS20C16_33570 [Phycisphaerae bacterium]